MACFNRNQFRRHTEANRNHQQQQNKQMVSVLIRQIKYICILYIARNKLVNDIFLYLYGITNAQSAVSKKIQKKKTKNKTNPILCWCENISYSHSFKLFSERCVLGCVCVCVCTFVLCGLCIAEVTFSNARITYDRVYF